MDRKQNLGFKSDKAVLLLFFFFSLLLPHGDGKSFKEKVCDEQQTVTSQAVGGTWIRTGGYGQLRGEWVHFAIFPQSPKNVKFNTYQ